MINEKDDAQKWHDEILNSYQNYLKTSFYFKDEKLRQSFADALSREELSKGPFSEPSYQFKTGVSGVQLVGEIFGDKADGLKSALLDRALYSHQEQAIRKTHQEQQNIVVSTGTASGKTESFLYPILFELYRQHLAGDLNKPGVRALILYPMNALANDQRRRLGEICENLDKNQSNFRPTFGQYIGETPNNAQDHYADRLDGELIYREEMRDKPPHILLTNYSMLEYLLLRPQDSSLFDNGQGKFWQFIVLDEAHQYRGVRGMEMGMLIRRLKQRIRDGGYEGEFRCIATSATLSSDEGKDDKKSIAEFAQQLYGESYTNDGVIFGQKTEKQTNDAKPRRYHLFYRALEGAYLLCNNGKDQVVLNRSKGGNEHATPLEIALCRECGQHYYVGDSSSGTLREAQRDLGEEIKVEFYMPVDDEMDLQATNMLCRTCGLIDNNNLSCECDSSVKIYKCEPHAKFPDRIKECQVCNYQGGGDPVQEIVHGSDGPNAVIATALHKLLPQERRKVLSFADSRQEAAFFAYYAQDSYESIFNRNLILEAIKYTNNPISLDDLNERLRQLRDEKNLSSESDTDEAKRRGAWKISGKEMLTDERRISLSGVGLLHWFVELQQSFRVPQSLYNDPWNFQEQEARQLIAFLLDSLRVRRAITIESDIRWDSISEPDRPQQAVCYGEKHGKKKIFAWANLKHRTFIRHFLCRLLNKAQLSDKNRKDAQDLMNNIFDAIYEYSNQRKENDKLLIRADNNSFHLNHRWVRIQNTTELDLYRCNTCEGITTHNIRKICPRNGCFGYLEPIKQDKMKDNHYRILYQQEMPTEFNAQEHTAQITAETARSRQNSFRQNEIHLLSSSTTFEVGVDLGDLDVVFLRNVPPEPFNYVQRAGRAGRRDTPGLAVTYCRRNPHDLYHYHNPEERILSGKTRAPVLHLRNEIVIRRHITAIVLSAFFRENDYRFEEVSAFVGNWMKPDIITCLENFCKNDKKIHQELCAVVPEDVHQKIGLHNGEWINGIIGKDSRLATETDLICQEYQNLSQEYRDLIAQEQMTKIDDKKINYLRRRMREIADEKSLNFLSRKAIIPKYAFPVDVVELDVKVTGKDEAKRVSLQRDLSQAIAEYAPGSKLIANKKEWESAGVKIKQDSIKKDAGIEERYYKYDSSRKFIKQEKESALQGQFKRYLWPRYGFVASTDSPKYPSGRSRKLYTTRPFFVGFEVDDPTIEEKFNVKITRATPASMVVLCEGKGKAGFYLCKTCGSGFPQPQKGEHKTPRGGYCAGQLQNYNALGHEFITNVVQIEFKQIDNENSAYSLAYAILLGAARALDVPDNDLNVTITQSPSSSSGYAIILYDNVPGGAGLVDNLENENTLRWALQKAKERVGGECGCDESCYGCLRSYRNQFVHTCLQRTVAHGILNSLPGL